MDDYKEKYEILLKDYSELQKDYRNLKDELFSSERRLGEEISDNACLRKIIEKARDVLA